MASKDIDLDKVDFAKAKRGPIVKTNKVPIHIRVDPDVLEWFRAQVKPGGGAGYQQMMNEALRLYMEGKLKGERDASITRTLRRVVREELERVQDR